MNNTYLCLNKSIGMNKYQEILLGSMRAIQQIGNENLIILNAVLDFSSVFTPFSNTIDEIDLLVGEQGMDNSGYAIVKKQKRTLLASLTENLSTQIATLAMFTGNEELKMEQRYRLWKLMAKRDDELTGISIRLLKLARPLVLDLAPYGCSNASLDALQAAAEDFAGDLKNIKNQIKFKANYTRTLDEKIKQNMLLLKEKMDLAMEIVKHTHPDLYSLYRQLRMVGKIPVEHPDILGQVKDVDGNPVHKAIATLKGTLRKVKSTPKGTIKMFRLKAGTYTLVVKKEGFLPFEKQIVLTKKGGLKVEVELITN